MAIKAYTGIMGSGKTYEVASVVIYGALSMGRRVVSNIAGLNFEVYRALLLEDGIAPDKIGSIVSVSHEAVLDPMFWRTDNDKPDAQTVIQPGDLVVLDEVWRFWDGFAPSVSGDDGRKQVRPARVMNFMRMHRQMVHFETGVSCDLAIICQDIMDVHRSVRGVIEETYLMTKLTAVGADGAYRVDIFQKSRITRKPLRSLPPRTYKARFYPCYQSHSQKQEGGAAAREVNIDRRGNILGGMFFKVVLPLCIPLLLFGGWTIWGFFHPKDKAVEKTASTQKQASSADPSAAGKAAPSAPAPVDSWRVTGWYSVRGNQRVVLTDGRKTRFVVDPPALKISALSAEVGLPEGGFAVSWAGGDSSSGLVPGAKQ